MPRGTRVPKDTSGARAAKKGEPSAYARMQETMRKNESKGARTHRANKKGRDHTGVPLCAAKTRSGATCMYRAGWGTNHYGIGPCKHHGGTTANHKKAAAKFYAHELLGTPIDMNPFDAILWCIRIRAGEVQWLSEQMATIDKKDWIENTMIGKQFHLFARERQKALQDLTKFSALAVSLGIAERAVKLAETYGELLAMYTKNLLQDLWPHLDEEGRAKAPQFVRMRLVQLDQGRELEVKELPKAAAA